MASAKFIFIYITCPKATVAHKIAKAAVESRVAACANIIPQMQSLYRWEGRIVTDREVVLILKTSRRLFKAVERLVKKLHPYECPCIAALPVTAANSNYSQWLGAQVFDRD